MVELHEDREESRQSAPDPATCETILPRGWRGGEADPKRRYLNSWTGKTTSTPPVVRTICGFAVWVSIVMTRGIRTSGVALL
jgi:hypothetical protein